MSRNRPSLRSLLVPTEHGGWGFALEPGLLGILVAPGPTSAGLAVFALFAFLADRPTRLVLGDIHRGRRLPRTPWAGGVAAGYLSIAGVGLAVGGATAAHAFWWVLLAALPFVALQLFLESRGRTRSALREMAGPIALASIPAAASIADGQTASAALGLWLILGIRVIVSVVLVRAQIRRVKSRDPRRSMVAAVHAAGVAAAVAAGIPGVASWPAVAATGLLAVWAVAALAMPPVRANVVGVTQMAAGLVVVLLTALGYPPS